MNGWANYETWNVLLWIGNDERLYRLASECRSYAEFRSRMRTTETPDGVSWHDPNLDLPAIYDWWNDTFPKSEKLASGIKEFGDVIRGLCLPCRKLASDITEFGIPKGGFGNLQQSPDGSYLRYVED